MNISASPPRNIATIIFCSISLIVIAKSFLHLLKVEPTPIAGFIFFFIVTAWMLLSLYLNIIHREEILIQKEFSQHSNQRTLHCKEIVDVEVLDAPAYLSFEWNMASWGIGGHRLLFTTTSGQFRFGRGLTREKASAMAEQIKKFCQQ
ncbi:MAG: hypothetical protein ABW202_17260 [Duganella sp.]